jgi:hypothetical protein
MREAFYAAVMSSAIAGITLLAFPMSAPVEAHTDYRVEVTYPPMITLPEASPLEITVHPSKAFVNFVPPEEHMCEGPKCKGLMVIKTKSGRKALVAKGAANPFAKLQSTSTSHGAMLSRAHFHRAPLRWRESSAFVTVQSGTVQTPATSS